MSGLRDRGIERGGAVPGRHARKTSVAAHDGVHRIENGDVNNGHGAAGPAWPELFTEDARISRRHRSVVESAGVNGDGVPAMQRVARLLGG